MRTLKEYINEEKRIDFTKIDFSDFCYLLDDYAYDHGERLSSITPKIIRIKDIFGKDYISCNITGLSNTNQILKKLYRFGIANADYIHIDRTGKTMVSVHSNGGNFKGYMYLRGMDQLIECFGEDNLTKIYKFIS